MRGHWPACHPTRRVAKGPRWSTAGCSHPTRFAYDEAFSRLRRMRSPQEGTRSWSRPLQPVHHPTVKRPGPIEMRELDSESGLNHMYAFCEYAHVDASGLGMSNRLHVGDNTWSAGLLLEF